MATRVYHWKSVTYTDETLHEAPDEFLALLRERGVEAPDGLENDVTDEGEHEDDE